MALAKIFAIRHKPSGKWKSDHYEFKDAFDLRHTCSTRDAAERNIKAFQTWLSKEKPDGHWKDHIKVWKEAEVVELNVTEV